MKEHPIIFQSWGVRAIMEGTKTMTRRTKGLDVINENPDDWEIIAQGKIAECEWCNKGKSPKLLDEDGTLCSITKKNGILSHAHEDGWWSCPKENTFIVKFKNKTTGEILEIKCPYGIVGDRLWVKETFWEYGKWRIIRGDFEEGDEWIRDESVPIIYDINDSRARLPQITDGNHWRRKSSMFMYRWASRINLDISLLRCERLQEITIDDIDSEGYPSNIPTPLDRDIDVIGNRKKWYQGIWDSINGKRLGWAKNPFVWVIGWPRKDVNHAR
jgi:hypothetical protein